MISIKDIKGCMVLLGLSLGLAFTVNSLSPAGIPLFGQWDTSTGVVMAGSNDENKVKAKELINPLKVRRLIESGNIVLIDVRRADIFAQGHLPGARSVPLYDFEENRDRFLADVTPQDAVLAYCSGVTCTDSHTFAAHLLKMGFSNVSVYAGGFAEWAEMGFEVEAGS